ncbi:MAG: hypothetical protein ACP6IP_10655 [Candidatus Njordarchaeia archaeon]
MSLGLQQFEISPTGELILTIMTMLISIFFLILTLRNLIDAISIVGWRKANFPRALFFLFLYIFILIIYIVYNMLNQKFVMLVSWFIFMISTIIIWAVSKELFNTVDKLAQTE